MDLLVLPGASFGWGEGGAWVSQAEKGLRARAAYHFPRLSDGSMYVRDALGRIVIPDGVDRGVTAGYGSRAIMDAAVKFAEERRKDDVAMWEGKQATVCDICFGKSDSEFPHYKFCARYSDAAPCPVMSKMNSIRSIDEMPSFLQCKDTCLHAAARSGRAKHLVPLMLRLAGQELIAVTDAAGKSALYLALENRQQDVALLMVDAADAKTLKEQFLGESYLHTASRLGLTQVVLKLVERQDAALSRAQNAARQSALHTALTWQQGEVAALLAEKMPVEVLMQGDSKDETCLHLAVRVDLQGVALTIIERGGAELVGAESANGETPLLLALSSRRSGSGPLASGGVKEQGALAMAMVDKASQATLLMQWQGDSKGETCLHLGETCLHLAVRMGLRDVALKLVERGGAELVGAQNANGETPLMLALSFAHQLSATPEICVGDTVSVHGLMFKTFLNGKLGVVTKVYRDKCTVKMAESAMPVPQMWNHRYSGGGTFETLQRSNLNKDIAAGSAGAAVDTKQRELVLAMVDKASPETLLMQWKFFPKAGMTCLHEAVLGGQAEVAHKIVDRVGDKLLLQWLHGPQRPSCGALPNEDCSRTSCTGRRAKDPLKDSTQDTMLQVAEDYSKLLEETELADVTFDVDGEKFPAYRGVLAVRSAYFKAMFSSQMRCSIAGQVIKLEEVSAGGFRVLLAYLYAGKVPQEEEWVPGSMELAQMADLFQVEGLFQHFVRSFRNGLAVDNIIGRLVEAHDSNLAALENAAMDYLRANALAFQVPPKCLCAWSLRDDLVTCY